MTRTGTNRLLSWVREPYPLPPLRWITALVGAALAVILGLMLRETGWFGGGDLPWLRWVTAALSLWIWSQAVRMAAYRWFRHGGWTAGREALCWVAILTGVSLLLTVWFGREVSGSGLATALRFLGYTLLLGLPGVLLRIGVRLLRWQNRRIRRMRTLLQQRHQPASSAPSEALREPLTLRGPGEERLLEIAAEQLILVEAQQNYVLVVWQEASHLRRSLLRVPFRAVLEQWQSPERQQVHRSFLVRLEAITALHGRSRNYRLEFAGGQQVVPVSRTYEKAVVAYWERRP